MMFTCLGRGGPPTLPHGVNGDLSHVDSHAETEKCESLRSSALTLERTTDCGAPLQNLLEQNKFFQHNLSQSFWKGFGDIKEVFNPHNLNMQTSTFYVEDERDVRSEDDNFFEDITSLYKKQALLFQRSCEQIKDVYRVDIVSSSRLSASPFGEVSKIGGEDLYRDLLYCLVHMIGSEKENGNQFELVEHLRKAFQIEPSRHMELYTEIESKPKPTIQLSLCFVEARNLVAKNVSGTSSPYCTFYVTSNKYSPLSTSCKPRTLDPIWNETYTMNVNLDNADECLHVDVWNFETDDKFVDKLKRVGEIRDSRGLRLLLSDTVRPSQSAGDKLIGHLEINLKTLPACGTNKWWKLFKLDGKQKKERGEIHLIQHLFVRETEVSEHIRLIKVLLSHELVKRKCEAYNWRDNFSGETLQVLAQHAIQSRMSRVDTALARFFVYCQVHQVLPLDCRVFIPILEKLRKPVLANQIPDSLVKQFHETSEKLVEQFTSFIR